ncbi:hypothetical protein [Streptomyces sp. NPDC088725]|uniref:hypothetical protein n=1 Tax=Streptomyces sp. NPDC088725 TaxID=3365873 RepID=UPI00380F8590
MSGRAFVVIPSGLDVAPVRTDPATGTGLSWRTDDGFLEQLLDALQKSLFSGGELPTQHRDALRRSVRFVLDGRYASMPSETLDALITTLRVQVLATRPYAQAASGADTVGVEAPVVLAARALVEEPVDPYGRRLAAVRLARAGRDLLALIDVGTSAGSSPF